jgi:PAS domain
LLRELAVPPTDWLRVEQWHQDLMAGSLERIRAVFAANGLGGLEFMRSPAPAMVQAPANRFLLEYWLAEHGADGSLPPISAIDPVRLAPALGRLLVVEPVNGGADFRYRLYGSVTAGFVNFEMTGKLLSSHPLGPEVVCFGTALYRTLMERPEAVLTAHLPPLAKFSRWERLVLPFIGQDGTIRRFVVGNVPFGQDGRELQG